MAVNLEQGRSDLMAERQQLEVGRATLHAVMAPAVGVQSQQVVQRMCLLLVMVRMGSGHQLGLPRVEKSSEEDLEADPLEEVEESLVLLARRDLEAGLREAAAGSGKEKQQCSWVYHDVKLA
jgi:hypothetical protein